MFAQVGNRRHVDAPRVQPFDQRLQRRPPGHLVVVKHLGEAAGIAVPAIEQLAIADQTAAKAVIEAQVDEVLDVTAHAEHGLSNGAGLAAVEQPDWLAEIVREQRTQFHERPLV